MKLKSYSKEAEQILDDEDKVIATIKLFSNGFWAIYKNGKRIDRKIYATPKRAFDAFKTEAAQ